MTLSHSDSVSASRRDFIKRASALSVGSIATPLAMNLAALGTASAATATDYKALVCIFLTGGNDNFNTLVPYDDTSYKYYASQRVKKMVHSKAALAATALLPVWNERQYALNPAMKKLIPLFNQGKLAVQFNVGPLIEPVTLEAYKKKSVRLPKALFAHNTQQKLWAAGKSQVDGKSVGWAGRMGDQYRVDNTQSMFTAVSISGEKAMISGDDTQAYTLLTSGVKGVNALTDPNFSRFSNALRELITARRDHLFKDAYQKIMVQALKAQQLLGTTLLGADEIKTPFSGDDLSQQLKMVARMAATSKKHLGVKRQVFFVSVGGFDLHDNFGLHDDALGRLANAMASFHQATKELGLEDEITTFTASDFGRALQGNNDGTDHGWGGDHFIMGGAVQGTKYFGIAPTLSATSSDHVGQGRLIPTTSLDQYAAIMGSWFGLTDPELRTVLPNLANFSSVKPVIYPPEKT